MDTKKLEEAIKAKASNKNDKLFITCSAAFEIAENLNVSLNKVGKKCNELKVKISNCQLGCF